LRDEIQHAIDVLRLVQGAVNDGESHERITEIVEGLRHTGAKNRSGLLIGIAEALDDWLIGISTE
jgi:hypothetical protein